MKRRLIDLAAVVAFAIYHSATVLAFFCGPCRCSPRTFRHYRALFLDEADRLYNPTRAERARQAAIRN